MQTNYKNIYGTIQVTANMKGTRGAKPRKMRYSHHRGHGETGRAANRDTSWAKMDSLRLGLQKNY